MCQKNLGCPLERASARGRGWGAGDGSVLAFGRKCWEEPSGQGGHQKHVTLWRELTAVDCSGKVLLEVFCTLQSMK